jgi:hypothetical protein
VIVLCDLNGHTRAQAAEKLGRPESFVKGVLSNPTNQRATTGGWNLHRSMKPTQFGGWKN